MDIETITKLIDAGYTKADIEAMEEGSEAGADNGQQDSGTKSEAGGKDTSSAGKEQGESGQKDAGALIEELTKTVAGLSETVKAMQTTAAESAQGGQPVDKVKEAIESFIKEF